MQIEVNPNRLREDWLGNNIAFACPFCEKVFIVSAILNRGTRKCPQCGQSTGAVRGGREGGGSAYIYLDGSPMTEQHAQGIARLINERNELARKYESSDILRSACNYEFELNGGSIIACVERKRVQWYQWEICHLSVSEECEGKGLAYRLYKRAEDVARTGGARILQCTIREGNARSVRFFDRQGFLKVGRFTNTETGNVVGVWQKILAFSNRTES